MPIGTRNVQPTLRAVLALAGDQHDLVTREQLVALGLTGNSIRHRIRKGRLHVVYAGVYAVGRPQLTRHGRWMAAVLACGEGAVLSHRSAAALWNLGGTGRDIEVTVPAGRRPRVPGLKVHRRDLRSAEVSEHDGIPVTSPLLTLIDYASVEAPRALERAISALDRDDLMDPEVLREALDVCPRRPGVGVLKRMLDRYTLVLTDTELERLFVPIARRAGLPPPLTQEWVNGERVDFFWPELRLVVETDGLRYHRTPIQQAKDRKRDQKHTASGLTPLRFTHAQVAYDATYVEDILRRTAARLRSLDA